MFRAWNIVDCGLVKAGSGHYYWEARTIADELLRRGSHVTVYSHESAEPDQFPGVQLVPTFLRSAFAPKLSGPWREQARELHASNTAFARSLLKSDPSAFHGSLTLFPTITERQFFGALRWLARFPVEGRPKAVFVLSPLRDWPREGFAAAAYRRIWNDYPEALKRNVMLGVRSEAAAEQFTQLLGITPQIMPSPLAPDELGQRPLEGDGAPNAPLLISFVAGGRRERGAELLPEIVERCGPPDYRFYLQVKARPETTAAQLASLRAMPHVEVHEGMLERQAYWEVIAKSVVLLPYDPKNYKWRTSGVYLEAKCLGAPVLVAAGTLMARDVEASGNGLVFEWSVEDIVQSIARARLELPRLRANAAACASAFRKLHGVDRYVDVIEGFFASRP